jgi:hypothetical protein
MARTAGCAKSRPRYCQHCDCGNHRGCTPNPPPTASSGANLLNHIAYREPKPDCPCIIEDDKKIAELEEAQKRDVAELEADQEEEETLRVRVAAIEQALWGRSFEGTADLTRPQTQQAKETSLQTLVAEKQKRPSQPASKRRRSNSI